MLKLCWKICAAVELIRLAPTWKLVIFVNVKVLGRPACCQKGSLESFYGSELVVPPFFPTASCSSPVQVEFGRLPLAVSPKSVRYIVKLMFSCWLTPKSITGAAPAFGDMKMSFLILRPGAFLTGVLGSQS